MRGRERRPMKAHQVDAANLSREFAALRRSLGIKRIVLHDLRRTAAVNIYKLTRDLTIVQSLLGHQSLPSTMWYLDHDLTTVEPSDLEAIKKPFIAWRRERTA